MPLYRIKTSVHCKGMEPSNDCKEFEANDDAAAIAEYHRFEGECQENNRKFFSSTLVHGLVRVDQQEIVTDIPT